MAAAAWGQKMSANVAPLGFRTLCRHLAEFSESLILTEFEAVSAARYRTLEKDLRQGGWGGRPDIRFL
jgi:hypothetical protein